MVGRQSASKLAVQASVSAPSSNFPPAPSLAGLGFWWSCRPALTALSVAGHKLPLLGLCPSWCGSVLSHVPPPRPQPSSTPSTPRLHHQPQMRHTELASEDLSRRTCQAPASPPGANALRDSCLTVSLPRRCGRKDAAALGAPTRPMESSNAQFIVVLPLPCRLTHSSRTQLARMLCSLGAFRPRCRGSFLWKPSLKPNSWRLLEPTGCSSLGR